MTYTSHLFKSHVLLYVTVSKIPRKAWLPKPELQYVVDIQGSNIAATFGVRSNRTLGESVACFAYILRYTCTE